MRVVWTVVLSCALGALAGKTAHADGGMDLTYGSCPATGSHAPSIDCSLSRPEKLIGTIVMPAEMSDLEGMEIALTFDFGAGPVPAFWDFQTQNAGDLAVDCLRSACGAEYLDTWAPSGTASLGSVSTSSHSVTVSLTCVSQAPLSVSAGQKLFGFSLSFDTATSQEASGPLAGCEAPVCVYIENVHMASSEGFDQSFSGPALSGDFVAINGADPPLTITTAAGPGGAVSLPMVGFVTASGHVAAGGSRTVSISPQEGYHIADVVVDGASVGAVPSYTFTNVVANHTVSASFSSSTPFAGIGSGIGATSGAVAWGDYDGDGDLDLATTGASNGNTMIYENVHGTFAVRDTLPGFAYGGVEWGDFDDDGDLDLVVSGPGSPPVVLRDDGGHFVAVPAGLSTAAGYAHWGDFDNDGYLDLLVGSHVYRSSGGSSPTFTDTGSGPDVDNQGASAWGDFDNDGYLDILLTGCHAGDSGPPLARIYHNSGGSTPSFAVVAAEVPGVYSDVQHVAWVACGDVDNDGDLDFAIKGDGGTELYRNDSGAFVDVSGAIAGPGYYACVAWGDYDNDGHIDLLSTGAVPTSPPLTDLFVNNADPTPTFTKLPRSGLPAAIASGAAWGDYDNDGRLDIALIGATNFSYAAATDIYRGVSGRSSTPPAAPGVLDGHLAGTRVVFGWAPGSDAQTPAAGLSYDLRIGTSPGAVDLRSPMADPVTGYRRAPVAGPIRGNRSWSWPLSVTRVHDDLHWSVQSVDGAFMGSPFAAERKVVLSTVVDSAVDIPDDQGGWLRMTLERSPWDDAGASTPASFYSVWRRIPGTVVLGDGGEPASVAGFVPMAAANRLRRAGVLAAIGAGEHGGRYFVSGRGAGGPAVSSAFPPGTWELVVTIPALQQDHYVVAVPTISNAAANDFVVVVSTTTPSIWFASDPISGHSFDNLAPAQPAPFDGTYSGGIAHLTWGANAEPDLGGYHLYRGGSAGFTPGPGNLIATVHTTSYDAAASSGNFYKLGAFDVNGNESGFAVTQVGSPVGVDGSGGSAFALDAVRPNPARGRHLDIAFSLPTGRHALIELIDLSGRRVSEREVGGMGPGRHTLTLAAGRRLEPGLYWVRLTQGDQRRMTRVTVVQ